MANNHSETDREQYFEEHAGTDEARFHVVPHDERWAIKKEGNDHPEFTTDKKSEAVQKAKDLAKEAGTFVYIHNEEGRIEDQINYQE